MAQCEDFPCCGHEMGCCPDFDESGRQVNMKCTCGATVPLGGPSLCEGCLRDLNDPYGDDRDYYSEDFDDPDPDDPDCDADCRVCEYRNSQCAAGRKSTKA